MTTQSQTRTQLIEGILAALQVAFPDAEFAAESVPLDDTFITLSAKHVRPAAQILVEQFGFGHLSTITGDDTGEGVSVLYHFWNKHGITLKLVLPYDDLHVDTVTDLITGAAFYEREVAEMLGVTFDGHPNPARLFLPDDWEDGFPLRKDTPA